MGGPGSKRVGQVAECPRWAPMLTVGARSEFQEPEARSGVEWASIASMSKGRLEATQGMLQARWRPLRAASCHRDDANCCARAALMLPKEI
jgi:hypothetical protein